MDKGRDAISNFGFPAGYDVDHLKRRLTVTYLYVARLRTLFTRDIMDVARLPKLIDIEITFFG